MKIQADSCTLVLAGSWNPAIINPNWIAQKVLDYAPDRQFQVSIEMPVLGFRAPPKVAFEGISLAASSQTVIFFLDIDDPQQRQKSIDVASRVLLTLEHTPVTGVGFNFSFVGGRPSDSLEARFGGNADLTTLVDNDNAELVAQSLHSTVKVDDHLLIVNATPKPDGFEITVNVHYEVNSAAAAAAVTRRVGLFEQSLHDALGIARGLSGEELE